MRIIFFTFSLIVLANSKSTAQNANELYQLWRSGNKELTCQKASNTSICKDQINELLKWAKNALSQRERIDLLKHLYLEFANDIDSEYPGLSEAGLELLQEAAKSYQPGGEMARLLNNPIKCEGNCDNGIGIGTYRDGTYTGKFKGYKFSEGNITYNDGRVFNGVYPQNIRGFGINANTKPQSYQLNFPINDDKYIIYDGEGYKDGDFVGFLMQHGHQPWTEGDFYAKVYIGKMSTLYELGYGSLQDLPSSYKVPHGPTLVFSFQKNVTNVEYRTFDYTSLLKNYVQAKKALRELGHDEFDSETTKRLSKISTSSISDAATVWSHLRKLTSPALIKRISNYNELISRYKSTDWPGRPRTGIDKIYSFLDSYPNATTLQDYAYQRLHRLEAELDDDNHELTDPFVENNPFFNLFMVSAIILNNSTPDASSEPVAYFDSCDDFTFNIYKSERMISEDNMYTHYLECLSGPNKFSHVFITEARGAPLAYIAGPYLYKTKSQAASFACGCN